MHTVVSSVSFLGMSAGSTEMRGLESQHSK